MEVLYDWVNKEGIYEPKWTENNTKVTIGEETYSLEAFGMPAIMLVCKVFSCRFFFVGFLFVCVVSSVFIL